MYDSELITFAQLCGITYHRSSNTGGIFIMCNNHLWIGGQWYINVLSDLPEIPISAWHMKDLRWRSKKCPIPN